MISPKLILPLVLSLISAPAFSQQVLWMDQFGSYGDDRVRTVASDGAGGCILSGEVNVQQSADVWAARIDGSGNVLWSVQFGTSSWESSLSDVSAPNGGVFLGGMTFGNLSGSNPSGGGDAWIAKYNATGTREWLHQFGTVAASDNITCGDKDGLGGAYFGGNTSGGIGYGYTGGGGAWIGRFSPDGTILWIRHVGGTLPGTVESIANDGSGGAFVAVGGSDSWIARYDRFGNEVLLVTLPRKYVQSATYRSGRLFVTWYDDVNACLSVGRFDTAGSLMWTTQLSPGYGHTRLLSDGAGGAFVSIGSNGSTMTNSTLARIAGDGTITWLTGVAGANWSLCTDGAVGFYFAGEALGSVGGPSAGGSDCWWGRYGLYPCYPDVDLDGFGSGTASYSPTPCGSGTAMNDLDCDDALAFVHPGAPDLCDGLDNDCDGEVDELFVQSYCTAGTSVHGCVPQIRGDGLPSSSLPSGFDLIVDAMPGQRAATIFYGFYPAGQVWAPFSTSYLCVAPPVQRTGNLNTGGTAGQCNGTLTLDFNVWRHSNPSALGAPFVAGQILHAQAWYRDPAAPSQTNLSNALRFALCN